MVHSSEIHIFKQVNVDFGFELWYAEYVGRALDRSSFLCSGRAADKRNDP